MPTTSRIVRSLSGIVPWTASPSRVTSRYDSFFVVKPRVTSHRSSPWWNATRTYPFGRQMSASFTLWMSVRVVLPYRANVIASRIDDFPAPVRPVMTVYFSGNRSGGTRLLKDLVQARRLDPPHGESFRTGCHL